MYLAHPGDNVLITVGKISISPGGGSAVKSRGIFVVNVLLRRHLKPPSERRWHVIHAVLSVPCGELHFHACAILWRKAPAALMLAGMSPATGGCRRRLKCTLAQSTVA